MGKEIWVNAKTFKEDYTGEYIVSNNGRCFSLKRNKFIGRWNKNGYWMVSLSKNNKAEILMIGRLMLISFEKPIPEHLKDLPTNKLQCMHLDGNSKNNMLENFAWGNAKENNNEIKTIIRRSISHKGKIGKECQNSKPVLQYTKDGEFVREWDCLTDVERELGIFQSNISHCCSGKRKSSGGFIWKYR